MDQYGEKRFYTARTLNILLACYELIMLQLDKFQILAKFGKISIRSEWIT